MNKRDLEKIESRMHGAPPGPWVSREYQDALFIAHAREDIQALLTEVRRLNAIIERAADSIAQEPGPGPWAEWLDLLEEGP